MKYKINIVNSHTWDSDVYFARLKNYVNFKLVSSFHGHYAFLADKRENFNSKIHSFETELQKQRHENSYLNRDLN